MRKTLLLIVALASAIWSCEHDAAIAEEPAANDASTFTLHPIGQVRVTDQHARIVIDKRYAPGLLGLEGFSHIQVFWWFSRNDTPQRRSILQVHPRGNPQNPLTGVFATRAPFRPNLIALTLCKITSIHDNVIEIEKIDAFDGTPVLDIKPFIPGYDSVDQAATPQWLKNMRAQSPDS